MGSDQPSQTFAIQVMAGSSGQGRQSLSCSRSTSGIVIERNTLWFDYSRLERICGKNTRSERPSTLVLIVLPSCRLLRCEANESEREAKLSKKKGPRPLGCDGPPKSSVSSTCQTWRSFEGLAIVMLLAEFEVELVEGCLQIGTFHAYCVFKTNLSLAPGPAFGPKLAPI